MRFSPNFKKQLHPNHGLYDKDPVMVYTRDRDLPSGVGEDIRFFATLRDAAQELESENWQDEDEESHGVTAEFILMHFPWEEDFSVEGDTFSIYICLSSQALPRAMTRAFQDQK